MASRSPAFPRQSEPQPTESALPQPIEALRKKNAIPDTVSRTGGVKSTVGIVFENNTVAMMVPGGPAYKPLNSGGLQGQRIDKGDQIVKIDGKEVTSGNLIPLLRGRDVIGSPVTVEIQNESEQEPMSFTLHRADIRR